MWFISLELKLRIVFCYLLFPFLFQPRDLENDTKSVHSYDEASLAAGQTYQVRTNDTEEQVLDWLEMSDLRPVLIGGLFSYRRLMFRCWNLLWTWPKMLMTVKRKTSLDTLKVGTLIVSECFFLPALGVTALCSPSGCP